MGLPAIPNRHQDSGAHRQRIAETVNGITSFQFDDSRVRSQAEITAGVTPVNYAYAPGDVRRYGAVGDGVTDDTTALQNAANAAGASGIVIFPTNRVYSCAGSITIPNFQTWKGESYEPGAGGATASITSTMTSGRFITTGFSPTFENIRFVGVISYTDATGAVSGSTTYCLTLADAVTLKNVVFQKQFICMETKAAFYIRIYGGEIVRCGRFIDMVSADVFNMEIDGTIFRLCNSVLSSRDTPKRYVHNLKVNGGSFESWLGLFDSIASASFFGSYFECDIAGAVGFNSDASFTGVVQLSLFGCFIFLNNLDRFVNFSGISGGTFTSIGNTICGSVNSGQNQFYFVPQNLGTGRVVMCGDYLDDRGTGNPFQGSYTSDDAKLVNQMIVWPRGGFADHPKVRQTWVDGAVAIKRKVITYSASMTPDLYDGIEFDITATNGTAFTINAPLHPVDGQRITFTIKNGSGGALGAVTWNAVFKMSAWTSPANAFNRSIDFRYDGVNWVQVSQTGVDVPN